MLYLHKTAIYYLSINNNPVLLHDDAEVLYRITYDLWIIRVNGELILQHKDTNSPITEDDKLFQHASCINNDEYIAIQYNKDCDALVYVSEENNVYHLEVYQHKISSLSRYRIDMDFKSIVMNISPNIRNPSLLFLSILPNSIRQVIRWDGNKKRMIRSLDSPCEVAQLQNGYIVKENSTYTFIYFDGNSKKVSNVEYCNGYNYSRDEGEYRINGYLASGLERTTTKSARKA